MSPRVLQATLLFERERFIEAESLLRAALDDGEGSATVHAMLALCLMHGQLPDAARQEVKTALALDPNSAYAHYVLSYVGAEAGPKHASFVTVPAVKSVRRALELSPNEVIYLLRLAELHQMAQQWKKSLEPLETALRLSPHHVRAAVLRAEALAHLGHRQEAHETLLRALESDPEASAAHAGMGWALLRTGDYRRATKFFDEALRLHPELGWAQHGAFECAKHRYWLYRLLAYPSQRFQPALRLALELGVIAVLSFTMIGLMMWQPQWSNGPLLTVLVLFPALACLLQVTKDPLFSWLVRHHRSARLSANQPHIEEESKKWLIGIAVGGATLIFTLLLEHSTTPLIFACLGLMPGGASLWITLYDTPTGNGRKWLLVYSVAFLIIGPVVMIGCREFILGLDLDPRGAVLLLVPAIFVVIVSARLKTKDRTQRHQQTVAASRKKMISP